jgi:hypothetical protein
MRFRIGFLSGAAAGYVLGTRAGRERYQQIQRWWRSFTGSPQVHQIAGRGKELVSDAGRKGVDAVQRSVSKVGSNVRDRLGDGRGDDTTAQRMGI